MEEVVFPNVFEAAKPLLVKDGVILLTGKISMREEEKPKLIAESIRDISKISETFPEKSLYLNFPSQADPNVTWAAELLNKFPGNSRVVFCFADTKKKMGRKGSGILLDEKLLSELTKRLGEKNLIVR